VTALPPVQPGPRPANRNLTAAIWALLVAGLIVVIAAGVREIWLSAERQEFRILPVLGQISDFHLTERNGQNRSLADLQGEIWLADFFFSTCPGPCPILSSRMAELAQAVKRTKGKVRIVSITVDPATDTPERLRAYAQQYGAGSNWWFLTGPLSEIYRLAREGFKLVVEENPPASVLQSGKMLHSTKVALVDGRGQVRAYYNGTEADLLARVLPDVGDLLRESEQKK
jgi:protein SCO1/2